MGFIDLKEKTNDKSNLIPKGIYEMQISKVTGDASKGGHEYMKFDFLIRDDLDKVPELKDTNAKEHGRHYFANVWTAKDPNTGQDSGEYSQEDLANIADAIGLTQAQIDKYIKGKDDLMKACEGKFVRIYVSLGENEYQGEKRKQNSTFTNSWHPTKYPKQGAKPAADDPFQGTRGDANATELSDADIPF
ncbi:MULTISPECIES: DUF669 domain-containing protein [Lactobacillus]|uniref:DUF669 domain-containing protein n=1 Tax=Lactobacillus xujianguonis TaxID=2495899 RepID=A0A437SY01_9LACO|nr:MULTISPECIES: DUF669 domain-containing protein [Lactobacillus]RVU71803.1 DUF669 domain-containing protein [Lactobacillus xujianguonis]